MKDREKYPDLLRIEADIDERKMKGLSKDDIIILDERTSFVPENSKEYQIDIYGGPCFISENGFESILDDWSSMKYADYNEMYKHMGYSIEGYAYGLVGLSSAIINYDKELLAVDAWFYEKIAKDFLHRPSYSSPVILKKSFRHFSKLIPLLCVFKHPERFVKIFVDSLIYAKQDNNKKTVKSDRNYSEEDIIEYFQQLQQLDIMNNDKVREIVEKGIQRFNEAVDERKKEDHATMMFGIKLFLAIVGIITAFIVFKFHTAFISTGLKVAYVVIAILCMLVYIFN